MSDSLMLYDAPSLNLSLDQHSLLSPKFTAGESPAAPSCMLFNLTNGIWVTYCKL